MDDQRAIEFNIDVEADRRMAGRLADAGVLKPEDISSGRADMGKIAEILRSRNVDEELQPILAEKIARDAEFDQLSRQQAAENGEAEEQQVPRQPEQVAQPNEKNAAPEDRLTALQRELDERKAETDKWKTLYGKSRNTLGDLKQKVAALEQKSGPVSNVPYVVDTRAVVGKDPNETITAQDFTNAFMSLATALGNQVRQAQAETVAEIRGSSETQIDPETEEFLLATHDWLEQLPQGPQRQRAMKDIISTQAAPGGTPAPAQRTGPQMDQARAKVRDAGYIEQSNRGSAPETKSVAPETAAKQEILAKLQAALSRPGGSEEAVKLMAQLGAGPVDDLENPPSIRRRF